MKCSEPERGSLSHSLYAVQDSGEIEICSANCAHVVAFTGPGNKPDQTKPLACFGSDLPLRFGELRSSQGYCEQVVR
jgi:hypothetical protein